MRPIVLVVLVLTVGACSSEQPRLRERTLFWEGTLAHEVPPGTGRDAILAWASSRHIHMTELTERHMLEATLEVVPDEGIIHFPCGSWNIIVYVTLNAEGHSLENRITTVGTCI